MARSAFGRGIAAFGVVVNGMEILGAAAPVVSSSSFLGLMQLLAPPLIGIWSILIGIKLYRDRSEFASLDGPVQALGKKEMLPRVPPQ
jgi:hypothetical protein